MCVTNLSRNGRSNLQYEYLEDELDWSSDPWPQVSDSLRDLIRKMLERNELCVGL